MRRFFNSVDSMRAAAAAVAADDGALDRSGQAGLDPVAGEKQPGHAGSVSRAAAAGQAPPRTSPASRGRRPRAAARRTAPRAAPPDFAAARGRSAPGCCAPRPPRRRSTRATGASAWPPKTARLSNTHCMVRPGRPTSVRSVTTRSNQRLTVTIGDAAVLTRRRATRPSARAVLGQHVREGVPGHGADDRRRPSSRSFAIDACGPTLAVRRADSTGRLRPHFPAALSMNARAGSAYSSSSGFTRQRQRGIARAAAEHPRRGRGERRGRGHVDRLIQRRHRQRLPQHLDEPRRLAVRTSHSRTVVSDAG